MVSGRYGQVVALWDGLRQSPNWDLGRICNIVGNSLKSLGSSDDLLGIIFKIIGRKFSVGCFFFVNRVKFPPGISSFELILWGRWHRSIFSRICPSESSECDPGNYQLDAAKPLNKCSASQEDKPQAPCTQTRWPCYIYCNCIKWWHLLGLSQRACEDLPEI